MNFDKLFPSKYLSSSDIEEGDLVVTIQGLTIEQVGQDDKEKKPVLHFSEIDKSMVLNKTNGNTLADMFGKETMNWVGQKIAIFATEVEFAGRQMLGLRIRMKPAGQNTGANTTPPSSEAWAYYYEIATRAEDAGLGFEEPPDNISAKELHKLSKQIKDALVALTSPPEKGTE